MGRATPANDGHRDTFGAPQRGWPQFDKDGKRIRDEPVRPKRKAVQK